MSQELEDTLAKLLVPDNNTIQQVCLSVNMHSNERKEEKCMECPRA